MPFTPGFSQLALDLEHRSGSGSVISSGARSRNLASNIARRPCAARFLHAAFGLGRNDNGRASTYEFSRSNPYDPQDVPRRFVDGGGVNHRQAALAAATRRAEISRAWDVLHDSEQPFSCTVQPATETFPRVPGFELGFDVDFLRREDGEVDLRKAEIRRFVLTAEPPYPSSHSSQLPARRHLHFKTASAAHVTDRVGGERIVEPESTAPQGNTAGFDTERQPAGNPRMGDGETDYAPVWCRRPKRGNPRWLCTLRPRHAHLPGDARTVPVQRGSPLRQKQRSEQTPVFAEQRFSHFVIRQQFVQFAKTQQPYGPTRQRRGHTTQQIAAPRRRIFRKQGR